MERFFKQNAVAPDSEISPAPGRRGPGRPRVEPPNPVIIDYLYRHRISWRTMERQMGWSTGTLQRAYDEWLRSKGQTRAERLERYKTFAPAWRNAPTRDKTPPRRPV